MSNRIMVRATHKICGAVFGAIIPNTISCPRCGIPILINTTNFDDNHLFVRPY